MYAMWKSTLTPPKGPWRPQSQNPNVPSVITRWDLRQLLLSCDRTADVADLLRKYEASMEPMHVVCALQSVHRLTVRQDRVGRQVLHPEERRLLNSVICSRSTSFSLLEIDDVLVVLSAIDAVVTPNALDVLRKAVDRLCEDAGEEDAKRLNEHLRLVSACSAC